MKKVLLFIAGGVSLLTLSLNSPIAGAMSVSNAQGSLINGWYKGSFSVNISYSKKDCSEEGYYRKYTFRADERFDGRHKYVFYNDQRDNPYLSLDAEPAQPLVNPLSCPVSFVNLERQKTLNIPLDALPPAASITSPSNDTSTSAGLITISGTANDSASGVASVQAVVNGQLGPMATLSGSTFTVSAAINNGANSIEVVVRDNVGYSSTSNTVNITKNAPSATAPSLNTIPPVSSSNGGTSPSPDSAATTSDQSKTSLKFADDGQLAINRADSAGYNSDEVLESQGLTGVRGKTYYSLILLVIVLLGLAVFMAWQFLPIFRKLDKSNSGLRRRIILIVALPSLIPLIGLGFLGYYQLTNVVERSLSEQLAKAAGVSALKLEREFSLRSTVITNTGDGILQIRTQVKARNDRLAQKKEDCNNLVKINIPKRQYSTVTNSDACLPFLTGFAQLTSNSANNSQSYLDAVTAGYDYALRTSNAEEQQRINELLSSVRQLFPELTELVIVDNGATPNTIALLPPSDKKIPSLRTTHSGLLSLARTGSLAVLDLKDTSRQLLLTYPIIDSNKKVSGGVIAKYNLNDKRFVGGIWQSTPKPAATDMVVFFNSEGDIIYSGQPINTDKTNLKKIAGYSAGKTTQLTINNQKLIARVSPVSNTNWTVAVASPRENVLAPLAGIQRTALLAIAAFVLISIFLGFLFVTSIAKEIERLLAGTLAFARGNLDYRIGLTSKDELQALGDTMDKMALDIKTAQDALIEKDKEFINVATHELRAPLTATIGSLSMITEDGMGQTDPTARKLIDQAYGGAVRLRELVNDMLDIARLESGREEFKVEPTDIEAIGLSVISLQSVIAQEKSISLVSPAKTKVPKVMADKNKLQIILTNFISNAIKYNRPNGTISLDYKLIDKDTVQVSIADSGLGIPDDQQSHIFEKFYRVAHTDRSMIQGTGLGLHITKKYIESMNGKVWFDSVHGKGTTFYFTLPVEGSAKAKANDLSAALTAPALAATSLEPTLSKKLNWNFKTLTPYAVNQLKPLLRQINLKRKSFRKK